VWYQTGRWGVRRRCGTPDRPRTPSGAPIEELAARLRRLRTLLDQYADPNPLPGKATKLIATLAAYDQVLAETCHALQIGHCLAETSGIARDIERLRVEAAIEHAGLALRDSSHRSTSR
jgi:hypothetical protein